MTDDVLSWDEWLALDIGTPDWLIPGLLEKGAVGLVHGSSQSYKSFFLLRLCLDLAAGYSVLDIFPPAPARPTLLFQAEGSRRAWKQRMVNLRADYPSGIPFWSRHTLTEKLDSPAGDKRMLAALDLVKPSLLVIDPLAAFFAGSDTDETAIKRWIDVVNGWRVAADCAVILCHHDRQPFRFAAKGGGLNTLDAGMEEARGRGNVKAWTDLAIGMRRKDDITTVRIEKVRDAPIGQEFSFKLVGGKLVLSDRADAVEIAIRTALVKGDQWLADVSRDVTSATGAQDRTIRRAVERMIERGEVEKVVYAGRFKLKRVKED